MTMDAVPPLEAEIRQLISTAGPMPVSEFMEICLTHPQYGYYMTRDPLGRAGDFITAPEISQIFGELIGLWAAATWCLMGSPAEVRLIELGPGRGTLMSDILRAARVMPDFRKALAVHLVETSPVLERRQRETLGDQDIPIHWHQKLAEVPDGPPIIIANEFFDALPVEQAVKCEDGWHARVVRIDSGGKLAFAIDPEPLKRFEQTLPPHVRDAPLGSIFEWRANDIIFEIARRVVHGSGAALIIDYGHLESGVGDTFQAVRSHRGTSPLVTPGDCDLTAHVDFQALGAAAESLKARVHGPIEQAVWLRRLGIEVRAARLKMFSPEKALEIDAAVARLTAGGPTGMGTLFKAIGLSAPQIAALPGFDR